MKELWPYGIYNKRLCQLVYIGLHESASHCWQVYLGWPTQSEIDDAGKAGLICVTITCSYKLPEDIVS